MPTDQELLSDALHDLAQQLPASDCSSLESLLARSRRKLRRRRNRRLAAAAVACAVVFGALFNLTAPPRTPATDGGSYQFTFDASFGWLPPGLPEIDYLKYAEGVLPGTSEVVKAAVGPQPANDTKLVSLAVDAKASAPYESAAEGVGSINGYPAYGTSQGKNGAEIWFRAASGQLNMITTRGIDLATAITIARNVRFAPQSATFPFQVTGLASNIPLRRAGAMYSTWNGTWARSELDLAVQTDLSYVAMIQAVPAGAYATLPDGPHASLTRDNIAVTVGLYRSNVRSLANPFPNIGGSLRMDSESKFLRDHITFLDSNPGTWTPTVLAP